MALKEMFLNVTKMYKRMNIFHKYIFRVLPWYRQQTRRNIRDIAPDLSDYTRAFRQETGPVCYIEEEYIREWNSSESLQSKFMEADSSLKPE